MPRVVKNNVPKNIREKVFGPEDPKIRELLESLEEYYKAKENYINSLDKE